MGVMCNLLQGMAAAGGMSNPAGAGWRGAPQQQPIGGATTFAGAGGGDSCQAAVLDVLQKCNGDNGLHITEVSVCMREEKCSNGMARASEPS
jgi:hypothetical protein